LARRKWLGADVTWFTSGELHEAMLPVEPGIRHVWWRGDTAQPIVDAMTRAPKK
jgi:hypothetical protein